MKPLFPLLALVGFTSGWFFPGGGEAAGESGPAAKESAGRSFARERSEQGPGWSERDIKRLTGALRFELNPVTRKILLGEILEGMTVENAESIRLALSPMYFPDPRFIAFYRHWGELAGAEVISLFGGRPKQMIFAGWSEVDPVAARDWAEQFEATAHPLDSEFHAALILPLARLSPEEATRHFFSHVNNGSHGGVLSKLSELVRKNRGMEGWVEWAEALPDSHRQTYFTKIAREWIEEDFDGARRWVETMEGDEGRWAVSLVAAHWRNQEGFDWALTLEDDTLQSSAIKAAVSGWVSENREEAMAFVSGLETSREPDLAVRSSIHRAKFPDFQAGLDWVSQISDPEVRNQSIADWAFYWYPRDPEGTDRWVDQSGLSEDAKCQYHSSKDSAR